MTEQIISIPIASIYPSPLNPRKHLGSDLHELVDSVREHGVLEPIMARPRGSETSGYEIVFGHRRHAAARAAGVEQLTTIVRKLSDDEALELMIIENGQRSDVHPLDEADGFAVLLKRGYDLPKIASKIGKPPNYVAQRLKLCALSKACRKALDEELITLGVALEIAKLPTEKLQGEALELVRVNGEQHDLRGLMTVADARREIETEVMRKLANAPFDPTDANLAPKAGACTTCPKRTGTQVELFADASSPDLCTDPGCFRDKLDAQWKITQAGAKAAGKSVLADSKAKGLFNAYGGAMYSSEYSDLDGQEYAGGRQAKVRTLFPKGELPNITVARNPHTGDIVELVPKKLVQAAIAKKERARTPAGASGKGSSPKATAAQKAANKRSALQALAKQRAGALAMAALVEKVEGMGGDRWVDKILPPLALAIVELCYDGAGTVALRRIPPDPKKKEPKKTQYGGGPQGDVKALEKEIASYDSDALLGVITELVVSDTVGFLFAGRSVSVREKYGAAVLAAVGVDPKKFEAKALDLVKAEQEAEEPEQTTKGRKVVSVKAAKNPGKVGKLLRAAAGEPRELDEDEPDMDDDEDTPRPSAKSAKKAKKSPAKKKGGRK